MCEEESVVPQGGGSRLECECECEYVNGVGIRMRSEYVVSMVDGLLNHAP